MLVASGRGTSLEYSGEVGSQKGKLCDACCFPSRPPTPDSDLGLGHRRGNSVLLVVSTCQGIWMPSCHRRGSSVMLVVTSMNRATDEIYGASHRRGSSVMPVVSVGGFREAAQCAAVTEGEALCCLLFPGIEPPRGQAAYGSQKWKLCAACCFPGRAIGPRWSRSCHRRGSPVMLVVTRCLASSPDAGIGSQKGKLCDACCYDGFSADCQSSQCKSQKGKLCDACCYTLGIGILGVVVRVTEGEAL